MTLPALYSPEEVAKTLKVTRRSVYRWLTTGKLRGLRAGDTWRIPEADVIAFIESRKTPGIRIGPKHPDYQRWLDYFKCHPVKRSEGRSKGRAE
jgi:excisionase family DNA binding protein